MLRSAQEAWPLTRGLLILQLCAGDWKRRAGGDEGRMHSCLLGTTRTRHSLALPSVSFSKTSISTQGPNFWVWWAMCGHLKPILKSQSHTRQRAPSLRGRAVPLCWLMLSEGPCPQCQRSCLTLSAFLWPLTVPLPFLGS